MLGTAKHIGCWVGETTIKEATKFKNILKPSIKIAEVENFQKKKKIIIKRQKR